MSKISYHLWGIHKTEKIFLFKIENNNGSYIELTNYGATLVSIHVPDRANELGNVILGFPELEGYVDDNCYIGSTIGRFANRIDQAKFVIDETTYNLEDNDNGNTNHGGKSGFNTKIFNFSIEGNVLAFTLLSSDGEGGFPGNLKLKVSYQWNEHNELLIDYTASSDKKTIANFTNHAYFNLTGGNENILNHKLTIYSDLYLELKANYIPTGSIVPAADLSFNQNKIKERISIINDHISGLNTCYLLDKKDKGFIVPACVLTDQQSGRILEVFTSYPGILLYTGDYLNSNHRGNSSRLLEPFDGLCLECQYLPDSPNHPNFPSTILNPKEIYKQSIIFKFSTSIS